MTLKTRCMPLAASSGEEQFSALGAVPRQPWIAAIALLTAIAGICANANAELVLQSATRSVAIKLAKEDGYHEQSAETTDFGSFDENFYLDSGLEGGFVLSSQTSDISANRIVVEADAYGHRILNSALSLFSVNFAVIDHSQDFNCIISYGYWGAGQVSLYDVTHSQMIFFNPIMRSEILLLGYGDYLTYPVNFQITLPEAEYRLTGSAIAITSDPNYEGRIAIDFQTVPEPSAFILLGMGVTGLLAYAWRRRKALP